MTPTHRKKKRNPTFYQTVIESLQWKLWEREQARRFNEGPSGKTWEKVYDMAECMECGWISQNHFQDFLDFVGELYYENLSGRKP